MGLFSKTEGDREAILQRGMLSQSASGDSCQTENLPMNVSRKKSYRLRRPFSKRSKEPKKYKFNKLQDRGPSPSSSYAPPAGYFIDQASVSSSKNQDRNLSGCMRHSPAVFVDSKGKIRKKKQSGRTEGRVKNASNFQRVDSVDSDITSSSFSSRRAESPSNTTKKWSAPKSTTRRVLKEEFQRIQSSDESTKSRASSTKTSSTANEYQPPNFNVKSFASDNTFDVRSNTHSVSHESKKTSQKLQMPQRQEKSELGDEEGPEFRQFVFDPTFKKIEKVAVEKSEAGASDFSDFVGAAAKLNQSTVPKRYGRPSSTSSKSSSKVLTSLRAPSFSEDDDSSPRSQVSILLEKERNSYPVFSAVNLALNQQMYTKLKTNSTVSDISVVSNAGATITSVVEAEQATTKSTEDLSEESSKFQSFSDETDPFKDAGWVNLSNDSSWAIPPPPPPPPPPAMANKKTGQRKKSTHVNEDALILSIMKAASRESDNDSKPDPSPTLSQKKEINMVSSDSLLGINFTSRTSLPRDDLLPQSKSEGNLEEELSIGPQKQPPKGLPSNAILGSMLFRQTFSEEHSSAREYLDGIEEGNEDADESPPIDIRAPSRDESAVSSVTQDASSFGENALDNSGWSKKAHSVLDQWRKAKELKSLAGSVASKNTNEPGLIERVLNEDRGTQAHINMFSA